MQYSAENIPDEPEDESEIYIKEMCEKLSKMADMKWEKDKMDTKLRSLMLDGANTGDFAAHVYWDKNKETGQYEKGDFTTELVDNVNIMFGNPNNPSVEAQPYILVIKRDTVSDLKMRAKANGISKEYIEMITGDQDNNYQSGQYGKIELDDKGDSGKALSILKYWKEENGNVMWNEATKYCPIQKDTPLGIKRYPIAWGNWEPIKNSYHGMAVIDGIIDNQISINQLFAMVSYWMKMNAFGKVIYDETKISAWSNSIGTAIAAQGDVNGVVKQLDAGNFNAAVISIINLAIDYTKEFIGAKDALTGQIDPEKASGVAIISTAKQAAIPMGNPIAARDQFVEDLGLIWGEFFLKKYHNRKVSYKEDGKLVADTYSSDGLEEVLLNCAVDVGPSSYWSEISAMQTLDNLLTTEKISLIQYLNRMPDGVIPDKQGLIDDLDEQEQEQIQKQKEYELIAQIIETYVPIEQQEEVMNLIQQSAQEA